LLERAHLKLAIEPQDLISGTSALLPIVFILFSTGLAMEAAIDIRYIFVPYMSLYMSHICP
jgi:hypothetical protein